jgi:hypothetical protein
MSCVSEGRGEPLRVGGPLRNHRLPAGSVHFADWAGQQSVGGECDPDHDEVHQEGVLGGQQSPPAAIATCEPPISSEWMAVMGGRD